MIDTISIYELFKLYQNKQINVIDVRQKEKFDEYHIPGSISYPGYLSVKKKHELLCKDKTYYVVDYNDEFAEDICIDLNNSGYKAIRVFGGIKKWNGDFK